MDVHLRVRDLIAREDSKANELHEAIIGLASAAPALRIVTTNYDRHLSGLLPRGVDEFEAPALPLGADFRGLVYLHGSVCQDPNRLVVTKADFGRAYLSEGWAAQFLKSLLGDLAVVFIGYGLKDTLVQSLSRPDRTRSDAANRWIPLLVHTMPPGCNGWLGMLVNGPPVRRVEAGSVALGARKVGPSRAGLGAGR